MNTFPFLRGKTSYEAHSDIAEGFSRNHVLLLKAASLWKLKHTVTPAQKMQFQLQDKASNFQVYHFSDCEWLALVVSCNHRHPSTSSLSIVVFHDHSNQRKNNAKIRLLLSSTHSTGAVTWDQQNSSMGKRYVIMIAPWWSLTYGQWTIVLNHGPWWIIW